jgi:hypothetical protein
VACLLKATIFKPEETSVARERLCKYTVTKHWLSSRHVIAATDTHATIEELLETVFSVWSVPRIYNRDQLLLRVSPSREPRERETANSY